MEGEREGGEERKREEGKEGRRMDGWIDVTSNLLSKVSSYSEVILKFISTKKQIR